MEQLVNPLPQEIHEKLPWLFAEPVWYEYTTRYDDYVALALRLAIYRNLESSYCNIVVRPLT